MDIRQLKENINSFSLEGGDLGSQGYTKVLLQLFGYLGHGKSSFINSCKYVLAQGEEFKELAAARDTDQGLTMVRNSYPLTEVVTIVDNRGCGRMSGFEKAEVYAQLGNFIPIGEKVDWKNNFSAMMEGLEMSELNPNFTDFIVPIFVYSAKKHIADDEMIEERKFLDNCVKMTGIVPVIVLTNKTGGNFIEIEKKFRLMGAEIVIAIENYTEASHIKTLGRTTDILMAMDSALKNVRFRLEQPRDPRRERIERKKFLLNYIHQVSAKHEDEKREAERRREQRDAERRREQSDAELPKVTWAQLAAQKRQSGSECVLQ